MLLLTVMFCEKICHRNWDTKQPFLTILENLPFKELDYEYVCSKKANKHGSGCKEIKNKEGRKEERKNVDKHREGWRRKVSNSRDCNSVNKIKKSQIKNFQKNVALGSASNLQTR